MKRAAQDAQNIDWLALLAPTPRRQAGLTAATLLRLTSSASGTKRQKKIEPKLRSEAATTAQGEGSSKTVCGETMETKRITHPKHEDQLKHRQLGKEDAINSQKGPSMQGFCSLCKRAAVDPDWKATGGGQACLKHALQCSSLLGFSLNTIKEEQVETEVSTCYCCSKEGCIKYCHRLALFMKDKTFKEPEDSSLSEVFHHHHHHHLHHHHLLQSARSITHPAAITISPNTYTCLPGYYVHFSHPDNAPSPIPPTALCPRSGKGTKLLPSTGPQSTGITHPVYCCTSVETCYGEPCRISSCSSYSSVIPAIARGGCSFSTADCTTCNHSTKRGEQKTDATDVSFLSMSSCMLITNCISQCTSPCKLPVTVCKERFREHRCSVYKLEEPILTTCRGKMSVVETTEAKEKLFPMFRINLYSLPSSWESVSSSDMSD